MFKKLLHSTRFLIACVLVTMITAIFIGINLYGGVNLNDSFVSMKRLIAVRLRPFIHKPLCPDCNVILVSLDTLGANHLPCYGYDRNTAPALCTFGKQNIMFDYTYANAHFTLPSHVSMFTGLLPSVHQVNQTNYDTLSQFFPFLPSLLHSQGYSTVFVMPNNDPHLPVDLVYNRGIDSLMGGTKDGINSWKYGLSKFEENEKIGKKTFLFLHTYYVHSPYLIQGAKPIYTEKKDSVIPSDDKMFYTCSDDFISYLKSSLKQDLKSGYWFNKKKEYQNLYDLLLTTKTPEQTCIDHGDLIYDYRFNYFYSKININTPEKVEYIKALYDQKINQVDKLLKPVFDLISQEKIKKNTILIITSDHGEEFMEHGEIQHNTLYDSNLKIPLFMYIPGIGGKEIKSIAQSVDLTPTILDLVGVPFYDKDFQGESLSQAIKTNESGEKFIVAQRMYDEMVTIRDNTYKLFLKKQDGLLTPYELYNYKDDPGETKNIFFGHPDIVRKLKEQLGTMPGQ